jgi:hypothetical protein
MLDRGDEEGRREWRRIRRVIESCGIWATGNEIEVITPRLTMQQRARVARWR